MHKIQMSILLAFLCFLLATFTHSAAVSEATRSRSRRQSADVRLAEYLAWIALNGKQPCSQVACGVVDVAARVRRSSADQRIAELQALLALSGSRRHNGNTVAHGLFDPDVIGKKKRDYQPLSVSDEERYNLLKYLIQRAVLENSSS
ncbi:hypothetical protein BsWGS_07188 [Bradybaena similaris]